MRNLVTASLLVLMTGLTVGCGGDDEVDSDEQARRDFVYWAFALAVGVALAVAFVDGARAYAQGATWTPEQLLGDRNVSMDCDEKTKLCKVSEEDMRWIMARDTLLNRLLEIAARQMKNCGVKGV